MAYTPSKALHPGLTVQTVLDDICMSQKSLSERTGLSEKHISQIVNGEASITVDTALLLENAIGGSATFWTNLEGNYQETKARLQLEEQITEEISLARNFPYNDIVKCGFVERTQKPKERVTNLWKFFGVNSLAFVSNTEAVAYRKSYGDGVRQEALASWLRCGELLAKDIQLEEYSESKLRGSLPKLRRLTRMEEDNFFPEVQETLREAGVAVVCMPHFQHTQVNGASRWVAKNPLLQLSIRGRDADKFWFTLFHELGHITKHGKKEQFLEFEDAENSEKEVEANQFAERALIPDVMYQKFVLQGDFTEHSIKSFANSLEINAGIVLGRLQHDQLVDFRHLSYLHSKLDWVSPEEMN